MKGTVSDLLVIMLTAIILVTTLSIIYFVGTKTKEVFQQSGFETTYIEKSTGGLGILVNGIPFITIILGIVAIVLAFQIPAHPIFAPVSFFILALYVILSTFFSNIFYNLSNNTILTPVFNEFPLVAYLFQYLPYIIAIIGIIIIIVQYSKVGGVE